MGQENEAEMGRSVDSTVTSDKPTGIEKRALPSSEHPASTLIDAKLKNPGGWRGRMLAVVRDLIRQAAPGVDEDKTAKAVQSRWRFGIVELKYHLHWRNV